MSKSVEKRLKAQGVSQEPANPEERAREIHFALNSEACGFYDDGSGQNTQCLTCRDEIMPILIQLQTEARLTVIKEAAELVEEMSKRPGVYTWGQIKSAIRALAKAAAPATKEG